MQGLLLILIIPHPPSHESMATPFTVSIYYFLLNWLRQFWVSNLSKIVWLAAVPCPILNLPCLIALTILMDEN